MKSYVLAAAVAAVPLLAAGPVPAATPFDGNWSVVIVTEKGTCDKAYRYPLIVRDGTITYGGKSGFSIDGRVDPKGAVRVRISYGGQAANGIGRLALKSGSGTWTAGNNSCAGRWKAERRA